MKSAIALMTALVMLNWAIFARAEEPPPPPAEEQPEVLTSGPVNESFAEPVSLENQAGFVAPSQPPATIEEVPAAEKPTGRQFVWIPGYWGWDPARNGYIWVSGCWRAAPPGMSWVPGYWSPVAGGWQWVAGFWSPMANNEIEYLPAPPPLTEVEAPGPPPSPDRIWVPPCYYWQRGHYVRRPGYWITAHPDWVWVPSHYTWTPRGHVFVPGHWDYSFARRGVLYAPVYFPRHYRERPGFSFSLSIVLDTGNFELGLFTHPRYSHYYFGDYYDDAFISIGIYPWFECVRRHTWYDPIYFHKRWHHHHVRKEPRWDEHERHEYDRRRHDKHLRPPRTYHEMETRLARMPEPERRKHKLAEPIQVVVAHDKGKRYEKVKSGYEKEWITKKSAAVRDFREKRSKWEYPGAEPKKGRAAEPSRSAEHREATPGYERHGQERSPAKRPEIAPVAPERRGPAAQQKKHKEVEMQPPERREAVSAPSPPERRTQAIPEPKPGPHTVSPARDKHEQPERVMVPTPPISGKRGGLSILRKNPPAKPAEEHAEKQGNPGEQERQMSGEPGQKRGERGQTPVAKGKRS